MYKYLLAWRYLRTRYIALASIVSVTLGVATLVIVNSVMAGFKQEMEHRLNGILSDIVFEARTHSGVPDVDAHMAAIREVVGDDLEGITAAVHVPAMVVFRVGDRYLPHHITLIGVDSATYSDVSDFSQYLLHPENREAGADVFSLRPGGWSKRLPKSGWEWREYQSAIAKTMRQQRERLQGRGGQATAHDTTMPPPDPYGAIEAAKPFDPAKDQHDGIILGVAMASIRDRDAEGNVMDYFLVRPGEDIQVSVSTVGMPPEIESDWFTVTDFYESKMSEYDSSFAFVPLSKLQDLRGMVQNGSRAVTSIQLKLKSNSSLISVKQRLLERFPPSSNYPFRIQTWRDMQGPLLAAVQLETTILNLLLFLIIAVAGFGILATFFMIVVEKTRDIGVLKALGAPSRGVMSIFMSYGLSLGAVGSGVGAVLGLIFVRHINKIAQFLEMLTGREVFDPTVYYFLEIPTLVNPIAVVGVVIGAVLIAVVASILPAIRAARLHPVEALRYE